MSRLWIVTLLAALGLATLVGAAVAAPTTTLTNPVGLAFEETEGEEEWELEEECSEDGFEVFCEEEDEELDASDECPLRSTNPHAVSNHDRLKVTIGYTTYRPAAAAIQIGRGKAVIGNFKRHLGRSGVLRFTDKLDRGRGGKIRVSVSVPSAGRYCEEDAAVLFR